MYSRVSGRGDVALQPWFAAFASLLTQLRGHGRRGSEAVAAGAVAYCLPGVSEPAGAMVSQKHGHVRQARARVTCVHSTRDRGADDAKTFGKPNQE